MGQDVTLPCRGLWTGQNPLSAPKGALLEAENVMSVRPDLIEYRPGFKRASSVDMIAASSDRPRSLIPYDGDVLVYSIDPADSETVTHGWASDATGPNILGLGHARYEGAALRGAQSRRNLYVACREGTFKLTSSSDEDANRAGMWRPPIRSFSLSLGGGNLPVGPNSTWGIRACFRKEDANEVITRSPPTIARAQSDAGAASAPIISLWLPTYIEAGDVIEVYRTATKGGTSSAVKATIGAEYFLTQEYVITAADISAGFASVTDRTDEEDFGAPLYTNPSRDGELKANDIPPAAGDICVWQNCVWWLNTRPQERMVRVLVDADDTDSGLQGNLSVASISYTNGSAVLTGFADTDDIHVGMAVATTSNDPDNCGAIFTAFTETRVVSKTATTITLGGAATGSGTTTFYFFDIVKVGLKASAEGPGIEFEVYAASTDGVAGTHSGSLFTVTASDERATVAAIRSAINAMVANDSTAFVVASSFYEDAYSVAPGTLLIEETGVGGDNPLYTPGGAGIQFSCTAPSAFQDQPAWPLYHSNDLAYEELNGVRFSKPDEPEHAPYLNSFRLGAEQRRGMRFAPLEGALIVFKEDGIYRISGYAPDQFQVDALDTETRLLSDDAVCIIDNRAYAWTDRGVVIVDASGVQPLSEPVVGMEHDGESLLAIRKHFTLGNAVEGCFMVASPPRGLVCLAVPSDASQTQSERWWVYALATGTWSRFALASACAAFDATKNALVRDSSTDDYTELRLERTAFDYTDCADDEHAITVSDPSEGAFFVETASLDRWVPEVGHLLYQDINGTPTLIGRIDSVSEVVQGTTGYSLTIDPPTTTPTAGAATVYETIAAVVGWAPVTVGSPKWGGLFREACVLLGEIDSNEEDWSVTFSGKTDKTSTAHESVIDIEGTTPGLTHIARCWPKRQIKRCAQLFPRLAIRARSRWVLQGITLDFEPTSERVTR